MVYICEAQNQKIMSRFKIGQSVVALKTHSSGVFKEGDVVTVDGFCCCPECGLSCLYLVGKTELCNSECKCSFVERGVRECFNEANFAPLQSFGDHIAETIIQELTPFIELSEEIEKR